MRKSLTGRTRVLLAVGMIVLLTVSARRLVFSRPSPDVVEFNGQTMGTTYSVKVATSELTAVEYDEIDMLIEQQLDEVNRIMSTYDATSELERFNRDRSGRPIAVSDHLMFVLKTAVKVSRLTDGAFDVTARPFIDAWGFGPVETPVQPPSEQRLAQLATSVGYGLLTLDTVAGTVTKQRTDVIVDLSAIAKGYGVDRVADALSVLGLCCFLVEVGGELRAKGYRADGTNWRVGVENPGQTGSSVLAVLELYDHAVATSGDYRNYLEWGGQRYAHIIDPRTSGPIPFTGSSVTVVHGDATLADAWATGLSVLGVHDGLLVAEREGIAAHFAWISPEGMKTAATKTFQQFLK